MPFAAQANGPGFVQGHQPYFHLGHPGGSGAAPTLSRGFTRLFPHLPPFARATPALTGALNDIGRAGGVMDAKDNLSAGPVALIVDLALSANNNNAQLPNGNAGSTFLGQFVDHDLTFDAKSTLGVATHKFEDANARVPALDLDTVYGRGPVVDAHLYEEDGMRFRVENGGLFEDLPRDSSGRALIADPRNDEHVILAGLHAAFLNLHNRVVAIVKAGGETDPGKVFEKARQLVVWHYQWIVLNELLPSFVGRALVTDILQRGRRFYRRHPAEPVQIPVEFNVAAYRFGHSMVRPSYRANMKGNRGGPFFGFIFDPRGQGQTDPDDMRGGVRAARRFVGWQTFFDFGDGEVRPRKTIDTKLSTPLFNLPIGAIADRTLPLSLPQRNLLRHITWGIPSGQAIAGLMRERVLWGNHFPELAVYGQGLENHTPLWYYILREAGITTGGQTLGPVGGRIVAEVMIGVLQGDADAWLRQAPSWRPTLPSRMGTGAFDMVDLLTLAGVAPKTRGQ